MASVTEEAQKCPRCQQNAMLSDYHYKIATIYQTCQDCGYSHDEVLRDECWDDQRLGRVDPEKNYHDITTYYGPGACYYKTRRGPGVFGGLGWDDPHGDRFRFGIQAHNAQRSPEDDDYVTAAYVSIYHPGTKRWERTYLGTGVEEGYRYRTTNDYNENRPLPWGDALKPKPPAPSPPAPGTHPQELPF